MADSNVDQKVDAQDEETAPLLLSEMKAPEEEPSLWTRLKGAIKGAEGSPEGAPIAADEVPEKPSGPRKPRRSGLDRPPRKQESRRTRLRRISSEKREKLAIVVGEKVEKVLVEKIATGT